MAVDEICRILELPMAELPTPLTLSAFKQCVATQRKRLALVHHPDRGGAKARMQEINRVADHVAQSEHLVLPTTGLEGQLARLRQMTMEQMQQAGWRYVPPQDFLRHYPTSPYIRPTPTTPSGQTSSVQSNHYWIYSWGDIGSTNPSG